MAPGPPAAPDPSTSQPSGDVTDQADRLLLELFASDGGRRDPYPIGAELRAIAPVHRSRLGDVWVLTRYDDCLAALRSPALGKGDTSIADIVHAPGLATRPIPQVMKSRALVFLNPPDHTRLRGLVTHAFTPRRIEALRPRIEQLVEDLLDRVAEQGRADLMDELAFPLPVAVIGELVGVPEADRDQFRQLVQDGAAALEPGATDHDIDRASKAARTMAVYFGELVNERKRHPRDDLISGLLQAREGDDKLTRRELVMTVILLFSAGFETTTNLIGNGVHALVTHPDQLALVRADRRLIPGAVEEILRYESPVQVDGGLVLEPLEIAGRRFEAGDWVLTLLGAANRDPLAYPEPDRFDVTRHDEPPILSFSAGIHYCLGAALARMEGAVVLEGLLDRFTDLSLAGPPPTWRPRLVLRGLESLTVDVTPA